MFLCNWPTSKRGLLEAVGIALLHHHLSLYAAMVDAFTRLSTSNFVALFLESILYGIYIITCWTCAVALTRVNGRWKTMREIQWPFLLTGILLLLNTTSNLCLQFYRCLELLVYRGPVYSGWMTTVKVCYAVQYYYSHPLIALLIVRAVPFSIKCRRLDHYLQDLCGVSKELGNYCTIHRLMAWRHGLRVPCFAASNLGCQLSPIQCLVYGIRGAQCCSSHHDNP